MLLSLEERVDLWNGKLPPAPPDYRVTIVQTAVELAQEARESPHGKKNMAPYSKHSVTTPLSGTGVIYDHKL
jgi:hypothetical protein